MKRWQHGWNFFDTYSEEEFEWIRYGKRKFDDKSNKQILADTVTVYENALNQRSIVGNVVYEVDFYECDYPKSRYPVYFSSYEEAVAYVEDEKKSYLEDEDLRECKTTAKISLKYFATRSHEDTIYYFDNELRMVSIQPGTKCWVSDWYGVDELFVYVPLPFKKGDILLCTLPGRMEYGILDSTPDEEYYSIAIKQGDWSDMLFSLYGYEPDDGIGYFDYGHAYPFDYEKCPDEELPEKLSILFLLRDVYQEEMSVADFLSCYSKFGRKAYDRIYGRIKKAET